MACTGTACTAWSGWGSPTATETGTSLLGVETATAVATAATGSSADTGRPSTTSGAVMTLMRRGDQEGGAASRGLGVGAPTVSKTSVNDIYAENELPW
eukprot:794592-Prymnesium_polylepis.2